MINKKQLFLIFTVLSKTLLPASCFLTTIRNDLPTLISTQSFAEKKDGDSDKNDIESCSYYVSKDEVTFAQAYASEIIAKAGPSFRNSTILGIGGLDDVLAELKRRVWTPLAAPPIVLQDLGITPVRGVLLYGPSGCGKTLLARTIGKLLSPARPLTVVSGPQLMDKFVGSSEKNLRELFDNPSPVYDPVRIEGGRGIDDTALHVIIMDEFDAMARTRGGGGASFQQGDAGIARDSMVNQILAKMDGVDPLPVPTLVIAMTNRRGLIDEALLRPGRFEVQIEIPPPKTMEQRISILHVHMKCMQETGRLLIRKNDDDSLELLTYDEILHHLATLCDGFSGASLAAVPRAAASRALERAVSKYSEKLIEEELKNEEKEADTNDLDNAGTQEAIAMLDCMVTLEDLESAIEDVHRSASKSQNLKDDKEDEVIVNGTKNRVEVNGDTPCKNGEKIIS